jgi:hypothetical protein
VCHFHLLVNELPGHPHAPLGPAEHHRFFHRCLERRGWRGLAHAVHARQEDGRWQWLRQR